MPKMKLRTGHGATLGLVCALILILVLVGCALFYMAQMLGGGKQTLNACDAGALTAARSIVGVAVDPRTIPPELQGLGVNVPPDPANPSLAAGAPDPSAKGKYNIFAYNRCAGACVLIAMNALEDGNIVGIGNADTLISGVGRATSLHAFGDLLTSNIKSSGTLGNPTATAFETVATENNVQMLGKQSVTNLTNDLQFMSVPTGLIGANGYPTGGKSDVYFNNNDFTDGAGHVTDPVLANLASQADDVTGSTRSVCNGFPNGLSYEQTTAGFQDGQPLLKAYQAIQFDPRISAVYLAAVNPASEPHLIPDGRFNAGAPQFGYAPCNAVQGQTAAKESYKTNSNINAVASAVVGAIYNEYPIQLAHGYIEIYNGPDARSKNAEFVNVPGSVDGANSIFNLQLYDNFGGGIHVFNNGVFVTNNPGRGIAEANAYAYYNTHPPNQSWETTDPNGLRPSLDPAVGYEFPHSIRKHYLAEYALNPYAGNPFWPPNNGGMLRIGPGLGQKPQYTQNANYTPASGNEFVNPTNPGLAIRQQLDFCKASEYGEPGFENHPQCYKNLLAWSSNYGDTTSGTPVPGGLTLTDFEASKGLVIEKWVDATRSTDFSGYGFTIDETFQPSGSKVYSRADIPESTADSKAIEGNGQEIDHTIAFGAVSTPYQLLQQLAQNGSTCVNPDDPNQYSNTATILGKLFGRCKEIVPTVTWTQVRDLLNTPGARLDLGQTQYIYSADGITLTLSQSPPAFLLGKAPVLPDGTLFPMCPDSAFTSKDIINNYVDAQKFTDGNSFGDNSLHDQPWQSVTLAGNPNAPPVFDTFDYCTWQNSSGAKGGLLGVLSFYNTVTADAQFSQPN